MSPQASMQDKPAEPQRPPTGPDAGRGGRGHALRTIGLVAVCIGVAALAAATFVLSYAGIHAVVLQAGITPKYARDYPELLDAMLLIALAAVLALRGAGLPSRALAWLTLLVVLGAAAGADAVHATGRALQHNAAAITAAVLPWALVLIAFLLLLALLRHARLRRHAGSGRGGRADRLEDMRHLEGTDQGVPGRTAAPLPVRTPQPWNSPSIVPGFSSQLVSSAAAGAAAGAAATEDGEASQVLEADLADGNGTPAGRNRAPDAAQDGGAAREDDLHSSADRAAEQLPDTDPDERPQDRDPADPTDEQPSGTEPADLTAEHPQDRDPADPTDEQPQDRDAADPTDEQPSGTEPADPTAEHPQDRDPADPTDEQPQDRDPADPTDEQPSGTEPADPTAEHPQDRDPADPTDEQPADADATDQANEQPPEPAPTDQADEQPADTSALLAEADGIPAPRAGDDDDYPVAGYLEDSEDSEDSANPEDSEHSDSSDAGGGSEPDDMPVFHRMRRSPTPPDA